MAAGAAGGLEMIHTVDEFRAWREGTARPEGVTFRQWLPFLRARLVCAARGHLDSRVLHRQEAAGRKTKLELLEVCGRCGEEFDRKGKIAQFPRTRDAEAWRS